MLKSKVIVDPDLQDYLQDRVAEGNDLPDNPRGQEDPVLEFPEPRIRKVFPFDEQDQKNGDEAEHAERRGRDMQKKKGAPPGDDMRTGQYGRRSHLERGQEGRGDVENEATAR